MNYSFDFDVKELKNVQTWLSSEEVSFEEGLIEQLYLKNQIKEMLGTFEEFPEDKDRVDNIISEIKETTVLLPVYIEKNDDSFFVMEGRHRMCAHYLIGIKHIPVLFCSKG